MRNDKVDHYTLVLQNVTEFLEVSQSFILLLHMTSVIIEVVLLLAEHHLLCKLIFGLL